MEPYDGKRLASREELEEWMTDHRVRPIRYDADDRPYLEGLGWHCTGWDPDNPDLCPKPYVPGTRHGEFSSGICQVCKKHLQELWNLWDNEEK